MCEHAHFLNKANIPTTLVVPEGEINWYKYKNFEVINYEELYKRIEPNDYVVLSAIQDVPKVEKLKCNKIYMYQHWIIRDKHLLFDKNWKHITVSKFLQKYFKNMFSIDMPVIENGIRLEDFKQIKPKKENRILTFKYGEWKGYLDKEAWFMLMQIPKSEFRPIQDKSEQQVIEELSEADIYVNMTRFEGFCYPELEAMACRCAVVSCSIGDDDFAIDGETCLKADMSPWGVYRKTLELIENPELKEKIRENGYRKAQEYSWEKKGGKQIVEYFKNLLVN